MRNRYSIGRIFYGISIAVMGLLTLYYSNFPYMLIPPKHSWIPSVVTYTSGVLQLIAGACIAFEKKTMPASLLLGGALLAIFCFYFLPYQVIVSENSMHFGDWENAAKELALAGGAFVIAGSFPAKYESPFFSLLTKIIPYGSIIFSITIISFALDHYLYANEAADYVPSWVPAHLFWIYFTGTALLASGVAIISKIKLELAATLLGLMTFTWFIILHIPRIVVSPSIYLGSEIASAFLALAYSGIAFVIAGVKKS